jgi:hypothetical protein
MIIREFVAAVGIEPALVPAEIEAGPEIVQREQALGRGRHSVLGSHGSIVACEQRADEHGKRSKSLASIPHGDPYPAFPCRVRSDVESELPWFG